MWRQFLRCHDNPMLWSILPETFKAHYLEIQLILGTHLTIPLCLRTELLQIEFYPVSLHIFSMV